EGAKPQGPALSRLRRHDPPRRCPGIRRVLLPEMPGSHETTEDPMVKSRSILICSAAYLAAALAAAAVIRLSAGMSPVWSAGLADLAATLVVFAFSVGLNNSSVYDPYWSVAPALIALWWLSRFGGVGGVTA